jgi:peptide/nickel transport system permease protein
LVGLAVPNFFLGLLLILLFAVSFHLFPATGYVSLTTNPAKWIWGLVLPVATLSAAGVTLIAKQARDAVRDAMSSEYIGMLLGCGLRRTSVVYRHALRNAAIPIVTLLALLFVGSLGGAVFVENVYGLPGLGSELVLAAEQHDLPVVVAIAICFAIAVGLVNLLVDIMYGFLNPKLRTS